MKSRTSCFNRTVFFKDITRFFPVWALYTIGLLLCFVIFQQLTIGSEFPSKAQDLGDYIQIFSVINCGYALVCAQLLFGDLYNSRMCNALHALPMRRETWFITHVLSGLCFFVIPNLLFTLLTLPLLGQAAFAAGYFFLGVLLPYLFFFGVAVFSVMCAGNRFALALVYGIINLLALLVGWILQSLYDPLLYGITLETGFLSVFCPLVEIASTEHFTVCRVDALGNFQFETAGFGYLFICGAVGILFGWLALLLYRRRHLESAGDFIVVKRLAPVFLILYTLCAGTLLYLFFQIFLGTQTGFLFFYIGLLIGYFTGQMLLHRTPNIFKKRVFFGAAAFALAMLLSFGITLLDPLGITRYIPAGDQVASVEISNFARYHGAVTFILTDPEEIDTIRDIHAAAIAEGETPSSSSTFTLVYHLKNGTQVKRTYEIHQGEQTETLLRPIFSTPKAIFFAELDTAEAYAEYLQTIYVERGDGYKLTGEQLVEFLQAVLLDCAEGTMVQDGTFHRGKECVYLSFELPAPLPEFGQADISYWFYIFSDSKNSYRWLQDNGYLTGTAP